jgi:hypothetical protein
MTGYGRRLLKIAININKIKDNEVNFTHNQLPLTFITKIFF